MSSIVLLDGDVIPPVDDFRPLLKIAGRHLIGEVSPKRGPGVVGGEDDEIVGLIPRERGGSLNRL